VQHADAAEWLEENPHPDVAEADTTWEGEDYWISLGNSTIQLVNLGLTHGVGNAAVLLPNEKFLFAADFVSPKRLPFSIAPDFNFKAWEENLAKFLTLDWEIAVHTHTGKENVLEPTTKDDVIEALQYLRDLRAAVKEGMMTNSNFMAIPSSIELPKYESWGGYKEFLMMNAWKMMTEEIMGPYSWRPRKKRSMTASGRRGGQSDDSMGSNSMNDMGSDSMNGMNSRRGMGGMPSSPMGGYGGMGMRNYRNMGGNMWRPVMLGK